MSNQSYIHPDNAANEVAEEVQPPRDHDEANDPLRPLEPRDADDDLGRRDHHDGEPVVNLDDHEDREGEESADDKYIQVVDGRPENLNLDAIGRDGGTVEDAAHGGRDVEHHGDSPRRVDDDGLADPSGQAPRRAEDGDLH